MGLHYITITLAHLCAQVCNGCVSRRSHFLQLFLQGSGTPLCCCQLLAALGLVPLLVLLAQGARTGVLLVGGVTG